MPLVILPVTIPETRAAYDAYFAAFEGDLILDVLFPGGHTSEEFRAGHTAHAVDWAQKADKQHLLKCLDTDTGKIVGFATWDLFWKPREYDEYKAPTEVGWLAEKEKERAEAILCPLWKSHEDIWGGRPHVYCQVVAVDPTYGRRGIGARLMQWGIDVAEQMNLPVYLESSQKGYGLYVKMGFETLKEKIVHKPEVTGEKDPIEVPLMVKMPSAANGLTFEEWRAKGFPAFD